MDDRGISRRAVLLGGLGVLAVGGVGAAVAVKLLEPPSDVPHTHPGPMVSGSFDSRFRHGMSTGWTIAYPPGSQQGRLRVLVVLHGRGGDHTGAFDNALYLQYFLAQAVAQGVRPFAIASVDGGDHTYWHPRRGSDTSAMVVHEFLPLLGRQGLDVSRIGLLGWSMGGYGVLYLSTVLRAPRVAAMVAESPAIWHHGYQSVQGAFDDAHDFYRHRVFGRQHLLHGIALRIDCGDEDGFAPVTRDLRASITPTPAGGIEPGGHDNTFWRQEAPAQLAFVGRNLYG